MTDTTEVVDLFDEAQEEFPGKEDLKDRLVLIWVTGKHGQRKGTAPGSKPYDWYETVTLVIDDGPNWNGKKIVDGEAVPMLVPSVKEEGPQRLDSFQYSQGGLTARLAQRVAGDKPKTFKPMLGRINSRKNSQPGFSASWSIGKPTEADLQVARKYSDLIAQISKELEEASRPKIDAAGDEFDE